MTQEHPITPPLELVTQWMAEFYGAVIAPGEVTTDIATRAAQWGADQELEACCEWIPKWTPWDADQLRAARRPKPPSLKTQALDALHAVATGANDMREQRQDLETIRLAMEQLP